MLDIKWVREHPAELDKAMMARGSEPVSHTLLQLDKEYREAVLHLQQLQEERNSLSKQIGQAMASGDKAVADELKQRVLTLKEQLVQVQTKEAALGDSFSAHFYKVANVPLPDVPIGADETANLEVAKVGKVPEFEFTPLEHFELGSKLGMMHFAKAAQISGSRFTILSGALALLERALGQFMLDLHVQEHGYQEVTVPLLVKEAALYGTAQLPKFAEDLFKTMDERWLISTSEISLTNLVREEILDQKNLPLRFTTLSQCFRSEAGAAGRDTRGMLRQHQFGKVELVSITDAESSHAELERMTASAENVLKKLKLPYRKMLLSTGDMGFAARKTYDLEVWLPGQNTYREVSSCSLCGCFQARRMQARYRKEGDKNLSFVHTLNGSGLAVGRTLIAVMENYQQADGSIIVPDALVPYMKGCKLISFDSANGLRGID